MSKVRTGLAIAGALILSLSLSTTGVLAADKKDAPVVKKRVKPPKKMVINGMRQGVLRVPEVAVWSCAGGQMGGCNKMGDVKHGTNVVRHQKERTSSGTWYFIKADGLEGWILAHFLKAPGT